MAIEKAKAEGKAVSPAIIIIPLALGLGAAGVVGLAAMAKAAVPPTPSPGKATLFGKVTDSQTGAAISGALLTLDSIQTYTDSAGNYAFSDIEPGDYILAVTRDGYIPISEPVSLTEGTSQLDIMMTPKAVSAAQFYMPAEMTVEVTDGSILDMYWNCQFSVIITNKGNAPGTFNITAQASVDDNPDLWHQTTKITLAPGESYRWARSQWIDFRRLSFCKVTLDGDWVGDNHSEGIAKI